jgi:hypothetical protein
MDIELQRAQVFSQIMVPQFPSEKNYKSKNIKPKNLLSAALIAAFRQNQSLCNDCACGMN